MAGKNETNGQASTHAMFYFALVCPPAIEERILPLKHWVRDHHGSRTALKSPSHITLVPPFWWPLDKQEMLDENSRAFRFGIPGLDIRLHGFGHFGKRVIFLRVEENGALRSLRSSFHLHMKPLLGSLLKEDAHAFTPHVTIATRDLTPAAFADTWARLEHRVFDASMKIGTISLLRLEDARWEIYREFSWATGGT